jgi:hypothetical protein
MAFARKFLFQGLKVLYNAVMNHGNAATTVDVRMRVSRGGNPVGSPPRVTDSNTGIVGQTQNSLKVRDLTFSLRNVNFSAVERGNACRVIASILKSFQ